MRCRTPSLSPCLMATLVLGFVSLILTANLWAAQEQTLYGFGTAPDGNYPASTLAMDRSGALYGTTLQGGRFGAGVVFKLTPDSGQWVKTVLYDFCTQGVCSDGSSPYGKLVIAPNGNIFGTTYQGGVYGYGVAYRLTKHQDGTWAESVLHDFGNGTDGKGPLAGMILDKAGNLYGTTTAGGTTSTCFAGCGTAFRLTRGAQGQWTEAVLYSFCSQEGCSDGNSVDAPLALDQSGNLYGTAAFGGVGNDGVVFELTRNDKDEWTEQVIHSFTGGSDGYEPIGGVIVVGGNIYGTTEFGGLNGNNGTVFALKQVSSGIWKERVLYDFRYSDGSSPIAELVADKSGNLYGTTLGGGAFHWGEVFSLSPVPTGRWKLKIVYSFGGTADGFNPHAGLIREKNGNLYGVTFQGGTGGYGTVFSITP